MNDVKLGTLPDESAQRDAIHVAVAPLVAAEDIEPGSRIGLLASNGDAVPVLEGGIGIADPWLRETITTGSRFWGLLDPGTITSLRHDWAHPAFVPQPVVPRPTPAESEGWLRDFADDIGLTYNEVLVVAQRWIERGEWHTFYGIGIPDRCYSDREEFWRHIEVATGLKVNDPEDTPFSCSC